MFPIESVSIRKGLKDKNMKFEGKARVKELELRDVRELMVVLEAKITKFNSHVKELEKVKYEMEITLQDLQEQLSELYPYVTGTLINWEGSVGESEILSITVPEKA